MTKRLRIVLLASLVLNLLLLGLMVGAEFHRPRDTERRDADRALRDIGNTPFVMALRPEDRAAMGAALGPRQDQLRANRAALRARFEAVLTVLRAEPFDPVALRNLLAEQRAVLFERQQLGEDLLIDRLERMNAEERAAYADRLDRSLKRGPRNRPRD